MKSQPTPVSPSTTRHIKKKNLGLIYESLIRLITKATLEKREGDARKITNFIKEHIKGSPEIWKELQLFRVLNESTSRSEESARDLVQRVRGALTRHTNSGVLAQEKAKLLQKLSKEGFFSGENTLLESLESIPGYKSCANIQNLLNLWRRIDNSSVDDGAVLLESLSSLQSLEEGVISHLLEVKETEKFHQKLETENTDDSSLGDLVLSIMTEKFNKKFSGLLSEEQKEILRSYISGDTPGLSVLLTSSRERITQELGSSIKKAEPESPALKKLTEVKTLLETRFGDVSNPSDDLVTFYLGMEDLRKELGGR